MTYFIDTLVNPDEFNTIIAKIIAMPDDGTIDNYHKIKTVKIFNNRTISVYAAIFEDTNTQECYRIQYVSNARTGIDYDSITRWDVETVFYCIITETKYMTYQEVKDAFNDKAHPTVLDDESFKKHDEDNIYQYLN